MARVVAEACLLAVSVEQLLHQFARVWLGPGLFTSTLAGRKTLAPLQRSAFLCHPRRRVQFKDDDAGVEGDTSYKAGERGEGDTRHDDLVFCFRPPVALGPPRQFTEGRGRSRACNL